MARGLNAMGDEFIAANQAATSVYGQVMALYGFALPPGGETTLAKKLGLVASKEFATSSFDADADRVRKVEAMLAVGSPALQLPEEVESMVLIGIKKAGTTDPDEVLPHIERRLTKPEARIAASFLKYLHASGLSVTMDSIQEMFAGYVAAQNSAAPQAAPGGADPDPADAQTPAAGDEALAA